MKKIPQTSVKRKNPKGKEMMQVTVPKCRNPLNTCAGTSDDIDAVRNKKEIILISKNPKAGYVCCEIFDSELGGAAEGMAFTQDAEEIKKILGNPFAKSAKATDIAKKMRKYAVD